MISSSSDSPSEIFQHVYLGSDRNATNLKDLKQKGIKNKLGVIVIENEDLVEFFEETFEYITLATSEGCSKVLVHCETGVSGSAAVVIAYAMKAYDWDLSLARIHVKMRRDCIELNSTLLKQLLRYESILARTKNERLVGDRMIGNDDCIVEQSSANEFDKRCDRSSDLELIKDLPPIALLPQSVHLSAECRKLTLLKIVGPQQQNSCRASLPCDNRKLPSSITQEQIVKCTKQKINEGSIAGKSKKICIEIIDLTSDEAIDEDPATPAVIESSRDQPECIAHSNGSQSPVNTEQSINTPSVTSNAASSVSSHQATSRLKSLTKKKKSGDGLSVDASDRRKRKKMIFEVRTENKQEKRRWRVKIRKQPLYRKARIAAYLRLLVDRHDTYPGSLNAKIHRQINSIRRTDRASFIRAWKQDKKCSRTRIVTYSASLKSTSSDLAATGKSNAAHPRQDYEATVGESSKKSQRGNSSATITAKATKHRKKGMGVKANDKLASNDASLFRNKYNLRSRKNLNTGTSIVASANETGTAPSCNTSVPGAVRLSDAETQTSSASKAQVECGGGSKQAKESPPASKTSNEDDSDVLHSIIDDLVTKLFPIPASFSSNGSSQKFKLALNMDRSTRRKSSNASEKGQSTSDDKPWRWSSKPGVRHQYISHAVSSADVRHASEESDK